MTVNWPQRLKGTKLKGVPSAHLARHEVFSHRHSLNKLHRGLAVTKRGGGMEVNGVMHEISTKELASLC